MDFRPDAKTLLINYAVFIVILAGIVVLSFGNPQKYYYSPEYTSHANTGNYEALSCGACHIKPFHAADSKTCSTSGCHSYFTEGQFRPQMLVLASNERNKPNTNFGALLAFHSKLQGKMD